MTLPMGRVAVLMICENLLVVQKSISSFLDPVELDEVYQAEEIESPSNVTGQLTDTKLLNS